MIGNEVKWFIGMTLEELEKQVIKKAYIHYKTKTATAEALGIAIRTLDNKLEKYANEDDREETLLRSRENKAQEMLLRARGQHPDQLKTVEQIISENLKKTKKNHAKSAEI